MATPELLRLFAAMDSLRASDLFLHEGRAPGVRVHGEVRPLKQPPTERAALEHLLEHLLDSAQRQRFADTGDLDAGWSSPDGRRFRVNLSRQQGRLAVVARQVPTGALDMATLGLPPSVQAFAHRRRGLVLVTGATGSGKSTTLAALVHEINAGRTAHVVTIEDPIEYQHKDLRGRVTQREVGADTPSFHSALRHVLRQSPDVIVIGELRDAETMQVAIAAALTGHLVLASLHTTNASQTLQRLLAYVPEDQRAQVALDLSISLEGVVSQRLVPADGGGRVLACEVLTMSPPARKLLAEQRVEELEDLMRASTQPEVTTFNQALLRLHRDGRISLDTGLGYATNPEEFALQARGMATGLQAFRHDLGGAESTLDLKSMLHAALERGASDLHVAVGRPPLVRSVGELTPLTERVLTEADLRMLLFSIMNSRQRTAYQLEREVDFALALDDGRRFRINAYHQKGHMAASLRVIPVKVPEARDLGLPPQVLDLAGRSQGLVLVCGPTGAGKSTTLACLVQTINRSRACRIITVEDPIEYVFQAERATIDQREVGEDTASFAAALRNGLRQDPDVLLVGEMRDLETVSAALTAAETGHLVLATLHANDAMQAIDRVIDIFPTHQQTQVRSQLSAALLGVVSQRLLPRTDGAGRVAAFEVMIATPAIRALIRTDKMHQAQSSMESSRAQGMFTLDWSLKELYESGQVSFDEVLRHMRNPKALRPPPGWKGQLPEA